MTCLVCDSSKTKLILKKQQGFLKNREYHLCKNCDLIFVPPEQHLILQDQKPFYDTHENGPQQKGYVEFLSQLAKPFITHLNQNDRGLDFGCGPGPTLYLIFQQKGFAVENYDPLYKKQDHLLKKSYDFITCTEVIEHLSTPKVTFCQFQKLLKKKAKLGIMTQFYNPDFDFEDWWYHRDPTHICFYQKKTFDVLANRFGFRILYCQNPVVIFEKV